jgi:hypothetical protein
MSFRPLAVHWCRPQYIVYHHSMTTTTDSSSSSIVLCHINGNDDTAIHFTNHTSSRHRALWSKDWRLILIYIWHSFDNQQQKHEAHKQPTGTIRHSHYFRLEIRNNHPKNKKRIAPRYKLNDTGKHDNNPVC